MSPFPCALILPGVRCKAVTAFRAGGANLAKPLLAGPGARGTVAAPAAAVVATVRVVGPSSVARPAGAVAPPRPCLPKEAVALRTVKAQPISLDAQVVEVAAPASTARTRVVAYDARPRGARGPAVKVAVTSVQVGVDIRGRAITERDGVLAAQVVVPRTGGDRGRADKVGRAISVPGGA